MTLVYKAPPSVAGFLTSEAFIALIVGPVGSTKTTAGIMKIVYHARQMAPCADGVRRSRCVWVRNTREQLRDTSIPDFLKWFPAGVAGTYLKSEYNFLLRFDDVECEVMFRGLDDANDVRRLLSLQASFGVLDEFREIHKDIYENIQGRLGRYPDKAMVPHRPEWGLDDKGHEVAGCVTEEGKTNKHLWGMSNPPDADTFWERLLVSPPRSVAVFFQPSALSPEADWIKYLPTNYYEDLIDGKSEDWVDVYVHARFGRSLAGKPVFTSFNKEFHVAKEPLTHLKTPDRPIIIGMDFGLNPSATLNQLDVQGRLLTFEALTSDNTGVLRFIRERLKPRLAARFPGMPTIVVGDPAGRQRAQTDEATVFDILKAEGFKAIPARTNNQVARITAVESFLSRHVDGRPAHVFDPVYAAPLIEALRSGYRYKMKKDGEADLVPEKNKHSHIADAHQYACLHADVNLRGGGAPAARQVNVARAGGWT